MTDHFKDRLPIRDAVKALSDVAGFRWVALRSQDRTKKCTKCQDTPKLNCNSCLSTGFLFVDKIIQAYSYLAVQGRDFLTEIGKVNTDTHIYIIKHGAKPKEGDFIAELDLIESTGEPRQPFAIRRLFKVQDSKEYRGQDGRVEYWRVYAEEHNFDRGLGII
jgi:hypothetical protein